jgi:hypothetical protein
MIQKKKTVTIASEEENMLNNDFLRVLEIEKATFLGERPDKTREYAIQANEIDDLLSIIERNGGEINFTQPVQAAKNPAVLATNLIVNSHHIPQVRPHIRKALKDFIGKNPEIDPYLESQIKILNESF